MISDPRLGRITQGTIFCGGYAEDYVDSPVWGVVITARCDATHEKTPIVNYLPVVTVEDWLFSHGGVLSLEREVSDVLNKIKNLLGKKKLSTSLLEVHSPKEIAIHHFPDPITTGSKEEKEAKKDSDLASKCADWHQKISACLGTPLPNKNVIKNLIRNGCSKSVESIVKDLIGHKLSGYYYLPSIGNLSEHLSDKGYVVLLREVHHVPRESVNHLLNGIARNDLNGTSPYGLCFNVFDFVCPVAEIKSPWIEHLMQSFCNLFGRIGVADIDRDVVAQIVSGLDLGNED